MEKEIEKEILENGCRAKKMYYDGKMTKFFTCSKKKLCHLCEMRLIKLKVEIKKDKEFLRWLKRTFKDLREVRTKVAGLSSLQWRINDKIKELSK